MSVKIGKNEPTVTWINQDNVKTDNEFEDIKNTGFKVLIKGPCDLNQIFSFIKNEDIFDCEFTYVSREKQSLGVAIEGMNHTSQIVNAYSITDEEKAWIINIACQKPIDFGYAAEAAGYTRLSTISPLYNFINDRLVDESAVLRSLS